MNMLKEIITKPPTCIFCGTRKGPFHVEDVFAEWMPGVLPVPFAVYLDSAF